MRAALIVPVLLLAGCGGAAATTPITSNAAPAPAPSVQRPTPEQLAAFVAAFRPAYPRLAAGRTNRAISHDADAVCFDLRQGEPESTASLVSRFTRGAIAPTAKQAAAIAELAHRTACPDA